MRPVPLLALLILCTPLPSFDSTVNRPAISTAPSTSESSSFASGDGKAQSTAPRESAPVVCSVTTPLSDGLDLFEKVLKIGAYLVGAAWVYFNYFKGRTYKARLEVRITGEVLPDSPTKLARLTTLIKNIGLGKVELLESGTGVRVEGYDVAAEEWTHINTYPIFDKGAVPVEPDEPLENQLLVELGTADFAAYRAQIFVNYGAYTWDASTIFSNKGSTHHEPIAKLA